MVALGPRGAGNGETLNAGTSSTDNFLQAYSGSDSVIGGSSDDTIVGGVTDNGATTMTGGAGNNLFFFRHGDVNGTDIITDLTASAGNLVASANDHWSSVAVQVRQPRRHWRVPSRVAATPLSRWRMAPRSPLTIQPWRSCNSIFIRPE